MRAASRQVNTWTFTLACVLAVALASGLLAQDGKPADKDKKNAPGEKASPAAKPDTDEDAPKELTIRNVTKVTIEYEISPYTADKFEKRTIKPGAIDRFPGDDSMEIRFKSSDRTIEYRLDPKTPHSFRYDNEDRINLYLGAHGRADAEDLAPWVPTPYPIVDKMIAMGKVTKDDVVYDLGCGDGRLVIQAAKKIGSRGVGIDIDPKRIKECHLGATKEGVTKLVDFRLEDATKVNVSDATVMLLYLLTESNGLIRPNLEKQLRKGARVVCHDYPMPGWKADKEETITDESGKTHHLYLYLR